MHQISKMQNADNAIVCISASTATCAPNYLILDLELSLVKSTYLPSHCLFTFLTGAPHNCKAYYK